MKKFTFLTVLLCTIYNVSAQDSWTRLADFAGVGGGRYAMFSFSIGNKGYAGTGIDNSGIVYSDFWEYDPATDAWTQKADFGGGIRMYSTGFSVGSKGYAGTGIVGSYNWRQDMWEYDPGNNSWRQVRDFAGGLRWSVVSFSIGNKGYMGTGSYRISPAYQAVYYSDFWEYDPATDTYTRKADVPEQGRHGATGTSIGGKGYIGTGFYYYDTRQKDWWEYDPAADAWTRKADLPGTQRYDAASFSIGNKGYIAGGTFYSGLPDLWQYDPSADSWTLKNYNPLPSKDLPARFSIGSKAYMGMGTVGGYGTSDFWSYTPCLIKVYCPPNQNFCYKPDGQYTIPAFFAKDNCAIVSTTFRITGATSRDGSGTDASGSFNPGTSYITWTVTDEVNDTARCTTTVVVDKALSVSIADVYAVQPGGNANTIYIGYGPNSLTLTAAVTGGTTLPDGSYSYLWSNGETSASTSVNPALAGIYNYSVTVTDSFGCSAGSAKNIAVVDVRCGNGNTKVTVCHVPPGNPGNRRTLCVDKSEVADKLQKGSYLGTCAPGSPKLDGNGQGPKDLMINPNPNSGSFTLQLNNTDGAEVSVRILDQNSRIISHSKFPGVAGIQTMQLNLGSLAKGIYIIQAETSNGMATAKMIVY